MANLITGIISLTVSAVILASVFISQVKGTNMTCGGNHSTICWSVSEIAMWGLVTLLAIVGMLYGVLTVFGLT